MSSRGDSTATGNAGEHLVMAHLLHLGFHAFMADRGNRAFDMSVVDGHRHSLLRVKTTRGGNAVWNRRKDGSIFLDRGAPGRDFCAVVDLEHGVGAARIYLVPTDVVESQLRSAKDEWLSGKRRDGADRKDASDHRLWFAPGKQRSWEDFARKWAPYLGNWDQLRDTPPLPDTCKVA